MQPKPDERSSGGRPRRGLSRAGVFLAVAAVVAGTLWLVKPRRPVLPSPPAVAVLATELGLLDGKLVRTGETQPFTGWMEERSPVAGLKSRSWISNGVLAGVSEGWFTNGVLQVREHFMAGVSEGPVAKWHANGSRRSEGIARAGKLEGLFRRWHDNGVLAEEMTLRAGQPDGSSRAWFPSGSLKAEATLKLGQVVTQKFLADGDRLAEAAGRHVGANQ